MPPSPEDDPHRTTPSETGRVGWVLEIPPLAAYAGTARLFVGAVARQFGVDEGSVDDLKLAVSEACNGAIRVRAGEAEDRSIRIAGTKGDSSLAFEIEDAVEPGASPIATTTEELVRGLGVELIQALFPEAKMLPSRRGGTSVLLTLPLDREGSGKISDT
jgi:serine/threonine-protein kinase RsbW